MVGGISPSGASTCLAAVTNSSVVMSVFGGGNCWKSSCRAALTSAANVGSAAMSAFAMIGLT